MKYTVAWNICEVVINLACRSFGRTQEVKNKLGKRTWEIKIPSYLRCMERSLLAS